MIPRQARELMLSMASYSPVVVVTGPRQAGKTTLTRQVFSRRPYFNLEDPGVRDFASSDPRAFLSQCRSGAILDEIQRVPDLLSYIQVEVDERKQMGQFVLTGSSQLLLSEKVSQSLAGRAALLELLPLSRSELLAARLAPETIEETLFQGAYPPIFDRKAPPVLWYRDYIRTFVERDLRQILQVQDLDRFQTFLALCAGNIGQLLNLNRISADAGISANTAKAWLGALEASFVVHRLRPHHRNFRKRVVKQPKLYFVDTGLACNLLGITRSDELLRHPLRGALFESWVVSELRKQLSNTGHAAKLYFWRNHTGLEIDILVDRGLSLMPIECKSGTTIAGDWTVPLERWLELAGESAVEPTVLYGGDESQTRRGIAFRSWRDLANPLAPL